MIVDFEIKSPMIVKSLVGNYSVILSCVRENQSYRPVETNINAMVKISSNQFDIANSGTKWGDLGTL